MATVEQFAGRMAGCLQLSQSPSIASRLTMSRPNRRCSALSWSTTTPSTASRISCGAEHFCEEIHRRIFEVAGSLIRAGKLASPITIKTFLGEHDVGGVSVPQYLARLAAEATTIINAHDYGRTIYDLAIRRELIQIGEDVVNVAYDSPIDSSPREQIEEAERRLYQIAEGGRYDGGFRASPTRSRPPSTWRPKPMSATAV